MAKYEIIILCSLISIFMTLTNFFWTLFIEQLCHVYYDLFVLMLFLLFKTLVHFWYLEANPTNPLTL